MLLCSEHKYSFNFPVSCKLLYAFISLKIKKFSSLVKNQSLDPFSVDIDQICICFYSENPNVSDLVTSSHWQTIAVLNDSQSSKLSIQAGAQLLLEWIYSMIIDHCHHHCDNHVDFHDDDDDLNDHWHEGEAWCPYNWPSRTPGRPASTWLLSSSSLSLS